MATTLGWRKAGAMALGMLLMLVAVRLAPADERGWSDPDPDDHRGWSRWHTTMAEWHSGWDRHDLAEWQDRAAAHEDWLAAESEASAVGSTEWSDPEPRAEQDGMIEAAPETGFEPSGNEVDPSDQS